MASTEPSDDTAARNRDVDSRGVLLFGVSLALATAAVCGAMFGLFRFLNARQDRSDRKLSPMVAAALKRTPPEPRLEPLPLTSRFVLHEEENRLLAGYGWIDPSAGRVRIPIERAMEILAQRGLPPSRPMAASPGLPAAAAPAAEEKK